MTSAQSEKESSGAAAVDLASMRINYAKGVLDESSVAQEPFKQFEIWLLAAIANPLIEEANVMTLATVNEQSQPNARMVFLKAFNSRGFDFHTNYESQKAKELAANPNACLVFYWPPLQRSVRIQGTVTKVSEEESDEYFQYRPFHSRLAAIASNQSQVIPNKDAVKMKFNKLAEEFVDGEDSLVPRPKNWGGYRLAPTSIEFWQGGQDRLHDRLLFTKVGLQEWKLQRLSP